MGKITPKPYKVFRGGEWVLITPEPIEYIPEPLKPLQTESIYAKLRKFIKHKKRKK